MDAAVGMIEVEGVAGIIVAADAACKAAGVKLLGWESIGGFTTVFFSGSIGAVAASLKSGERAASGIVERVVAASLTQPEPAFWSTISTPVDHEAPAPSGALGLLETRGYGVHVRANDGMVKAAEVEVRNVLTVHNRVVCTLIQGDIGCVREALDVGRRLLAEGERFLCSALLSQPEPDVLRAFAEG